MAKLHLVRKYCIRGAILVYVGLVAFSLLNYKSRIRYEMPTMFSDPVFTRLSESGRCQVDFAALGLVELNLMEDPSWDSIIAANPEVEDGGKWSPSDCRPWQKVAIIISYRDRNVHLKLLLKRLHPMLRRQKIYYRIFVVEQAGDDKFNKGRIYNVAVIESLKDDDFNCFIFQDVDLLPENDQNIYYCDNHAHHLSPAIDESRYHPLYYNIFGGVVSINKENLFKANGYSNIYWGWGNEDDELNVRTEAIGLLMTRPPEYIGRYKMIRHEKQWRSDNGYNMFMTWRSRWRTDGLNSLTPSMFKVLSKQSTKLYTNITVDVGPAPAAPPDLTDVPKESFLWFLFYYFP